ncbi:MAG: DUF134 domain-containing protein [Deltaproteobacteria bacterium]|nr:DUF134 domain-containing protein [Deltaproteobacteria bacterium]MBW2532819.1 DUF134 domain-containing protein [Deltaproteobacteria bacterium]
MGVSRATFARVLSAARQTVARAPIEGKGIDSGEGGNDRRVKTPTIPVGETRSFPTRNITRRH